MDPRQWGGDPETCRAWEQTLSPGQVQILPAAPTPITSPQRLVSHRGWAPSAPKADKVEMGTSLAQADSCFSSKPLCLCSAVHGWRPQAEVTPAMVFGRLRWSGEGQHVWGQARGAQMDRKHGWGWPSGLLHLLPYLAPPERGFETVYPNPLFYKRGN